MRHSSWHATVFGLVISCAAACTGDHAKPPLGDPAAAAAAGAPVPALSTFNVPLDYDFTDAMKQVENAVPLTFGSMDSLHDIGTNSNQRFAYEAARGPFTAYANGSQVYLRTTFSYTVRAYVKTPVGGTLNAGCGTHADRPRIVVELVAPLTLMPSWHLRSRAQLNSIAPPADDHECKISFLKINVTERVVDAARKAIIERLAYIDEKVAAVDLTKQATHWWTQLSKPIKLTDSTWLVLQPQRFRLKGMQGVGQVLNVQAGLDALPTIVTGAEPTLVVTALPPLGRDTSVSGFRIGINGNMDYGAVTRSLTKAAKGQALTQSGHELTIESITAEPDGGGRLALNIKFTGDAKGTLRLFGTPRHNAALKQIVMPDLDFDLKTSNPLLKVYSWLHSAEVLAALRQSATFPADSVLAQGKDLLMKGLNRKVGDVMTLSATVDSVAVTGIYVTPSALIIRAVGWGQARAVVVPKSTVVMAARPEG